MLSRAANAVYWMSRYLERMDNVARFIAVNTHLIMDLGVERGEAQWEPLIRASGDEKDFEKRYGSADEKKAIQFLTFDKDNPNSIISSVKHARENARSVRDVITSEMWETINDLYHLVQEHSRKRRIDDLTDFFLQVRNANHLFTGYSENTMSHGEGWHFARTGKLLERADKTARMLDVKYFLLLPTPDYFDSPHDEVEWGAVLKSMSGFEMYRKQFHRANYRDVAHFLIFDPVFPRSVRACVGAAKDSVAKITAMLGVEAPATQEIAELEAAIDGTSIDSVLDGGLHEFVDMLQFNLNVVDQSIFRAFFAVRDT